VNQEITLSYIRLDKPKAERQEELTHYSIDCKCIRCETDFDQSILSAINQLKAQKIYYEQNHSYQNYKQLFKLSQEIIKLLKSIYTEYDPYIISKELGLIHFNFYLKVETKENVKKQSVYTEKLIKTMYGCDHPLYKAFFEFVQKI
jgi:hypothetical protein